MKYITYKILALVFASIVFLLNYWMTVAVQSGKLSFATGIISTELSYHGIFSVLLPAGLGLFAKQMILVSLILVIALFLFAAVWRHSDSLKRAVVFGGLLGGVLSNLLDRYQHGYLLNTFSIELIDIRINFNVADIAICFAILFFIIDLILMKSQSPKVRF